MPQRFPASGPADSAAQAADTTYAGKGSQNYHSIPAASFHLLRAFSLPSAVAAAMTGMLEPPPRVIGDLMRQHRIEVPDADDVRVAQ